MGLTKGIGEATACKKGIVRKCVDRGILRKISRKHAKIVLMMGRSLVGLLWAEIKELASTSFRNDPRKIIFSEEWSAS